jgi:hypothetical protein
MMGSTLNADHDVVPWKPVSHRIYQLLQIAGTPQLLANSFNYPIHEFGIPLHQYAAHNLPLHHGVHTSITRYHAYQTYPTKTIQ